MTGYIPTLATAERFMALQRELGVDEWHISPMWYHDLVQRYSEPYRHYHTLEHIDHCLFLLDEVEGGRGAPRHEQYVQVELTLWYHDAIYIPTLPNNETESARLFRGMAIYNNLDYLSSSASFSRDIAEWIASTTHEPVSRSADLGLQLLLDIDLGILGASPAQFERYEAQIRQEYRDVPDAVFYAERARILRNFLRRDYIYYTEHFRQKYERQAQKNVATALASCLTRADEVVD